MPATFFFPALRARKEGGARFPALSAGNQNLYFPCIRWCAVRSLNDTGWKPALPTHRLEACATNTQAGSLRYQSFYEQAKHLVPLF